MSPIERPRPEEIAAAARRLSKIVVRAPLVPVAGPDAEQLWIKPEIHQPAGCFKIRGVFNAVASLDERSRSRGISTVSAGNTAKALAWAGRHFAVEARSLMPDTAPQTKIEAVRKLGGTPVLVPVEELFRYLREAGWKGEPYHFVHPWTDRDVLVGHGTLGLEIHAELAELDTVFVPVGGGGLLGGVGSALKALEPSPRIVAVEPEGCPSLHAAVEAGHPVTVPCRTICDGVAVPYITAEMFPLLSELADEVVLVSEAEVRAAIRRLALGNHLIAEGSGALAVAAAMATPIEERGRSVCIVTGGSIDTALLVDILSEEPGRASG